MSEARYDLYFRGEILAGANEANVKAAVAKIFKADAAKLAILFSGKVNTIKKAVDKTTAAKYQQAFKKAGAKLVITLTKVKQVKAPVNTAEQVVETSSLNQKKTLAAGNNWDILPTGSDLLKPDERRHIPDADIDTSGIKVVSPFAEVVIEEKVVPPPPSTSHITVADVGEDMNPERPSPVPNLKLDLSAFTVAEVGAKLTDKKEQDTPPFPDTNHIKLV